MHVLFWGTYDSSKPRLRILQQGLRYAGVRITEIHASVWDDVKDKSQLQGFGPRLRLMLRWFAAYPRLIAQLFRAEKADLIVVGYPGIIDIFAASLICRLRRIPIVWDVYLSLYDTIVEDRRLLRRESPAALALRWIEGWALRCPALIFMDTEANARRIESIFSLPKGHCGAVWVGVELEHFASPQITDKSSHSPSLRVLFYGQFIPLHGISTIVEAARRLADAEVNWTLIGSGQDAPRIRSMLTSMPLPKVRWIDWVQYHDLKLWISEADLCLGIFGASGKAASVIPNKVFQIIAAGKPLVTRDSPAIRELLDPAPSCVYLIPPEDPDALVSAVRAHLKVRENVGTFGCHRNLVGRIDAVAIGGQFMNLIQTRVIKQ